MNVLTGAAKSLTFPKHLTPMISFSGYARSPGAGEYFWMSLSMYACKDQQTLGWQWSANTFHLFPSWACYEQRDLIKISFVISWSQCMYMSSHVVPCHTMCHTISSHVMPCYTMCHVMSSMLYCWSSTVDVQTFMALTRITCAL